MFMTGKVKKSHRLWVYYKDYYKYNPEYSEEILFLKNSFIKNVLILTFICVDLLLFLAVFTAGTAAYGEKLYLHKSTYISPNCIIENDTWISFKFNPNHPEISIIEAFWQVLVISEVCILNLIYLVLIQTYSHRPQENGNLIKLTVVYIPIELSVIFILNVFRGTVLVGRLAFILLLQIHVSTNVCYSLRLWRRLKRFQIDLSYFVDRKRREFIVFGRVLIRYKWITILNSCLLQLITITLVLFTIVNVFGETVVLNPCWLRDTYGIVVPELNIDKHLFRDICYFVVCLRNWSITLYLLYVLLVQTGILVTHIISRCYRKPKVFRYAEITTPLCQGTRLLGVS